MTVEFLEKFSNDLDALKDSKIKKQLYETILKIEAAQSITDVKNVKKLKGFKTTFRIRIGDYRLGFFLENNIVELARFVHRKDIYKVFP
jgi:mRNA-degrading endonuclease RelE of RelBE toxin-antitoxin system